MRLLLTVVAALLYALGWAAGLVSLLVVWCWTALAVGWDDAHRLAARGRQRPTQGEPEVPPWPPIEHRAA